MAECAIGNSEAGHRVDEQVSPTTEGGDGEP